MPSVPATRDCDPLPGIASASASNAIHSSSISTSTSASASTARTQTTGDEQARNSNSNPNPENNDPRRRGKQNQKRPTIRVLPKAVIDQIAAGEVVQRPVSVVKELLENSLDAGATNIVVQYDGLSKLSIADNGRGIPRTDLELLCARHATSKLVSVDDFSDLSTFGFRGEALAATSMVSRLVTVQTNHKSVAAYSQSYQNGKPLQKAPRPCARNVGTTITVEDLFYNVLHRKKAYSKRESEEYGRIHKLVQEYAVHYPTVGFVCQRRMASSARAAKQLVVDCNTGQIPAVKALLRSREMAGRATHKQQQEHDDSGHNKKVVEATKQILSHVLESNLANHLLYKKAQGKFILFLNHRLVDLPSLKRALEDVYADLSNPNNRNKNKTTSADTGKPVLVVNLRVPGCQVDVNVHPSKRQVALMHQEDLIREVTQTVRERLEEDGQAFVAQSVATTAATGMAKISKTDAAGASKTETNTNGGSSSKKKVAPSKLVRTNTAARAGAIEPFLVSTQTFSQPSRLQSTQATSATTTTTTTTTAATIIHGSRSSLYTSIAFLRKRVGKQQCHETTQRIRTAFFMGALSHQRSLVQCGEELVMINHFELAKELFYQLALARFGGGADLARLGGGGIHVHTVVAQALHGISGSDSGMLRVNESNRNLARHVTKRLVESSAMLEEYFSIRIETDGDDTTGEAILTGLPVLLDGHSPQPHGLPIFLLRLATQVDWTREKHCFHGVCTELGNFYAMLPSDPDDSKTYVQHTLFPALSYLLLPSKNQAKNGNVADMTKLSTLYKVFER
eukprot:jgi/Psemu1/257081/estExt_Genewise1Plus.C_2100002